jgi:hypothetical protein
MAAAVEVVAIQRTTQEPAAEVGVLEPQAAREEPLLL